MFNGKLQASEHCGLLRHADLPPDGWAMRLNVGHKDSFVPSKDVLPRGPFSPSTPFLRPLLSTSPSAFPFLLQTPTPGLAAGVWGKPSCVSPWPACGWRLGIQSAGRRRPLGRLHWRDSSLSTSSPAACLSPGRCCAEAELTWCARSALPGQAVPIAPGCPRFFPALIFLQNVGLPWSLKSEFKC